MTRLWQAYGPWGPRRYSAYTYVAENKYLPKDWDWSATTLQIRYPPLPYLVPASQGGICDYLMYDLPALQQSVPNIAGIPEAGLGATGKLTTVEPVPPKFPSPTNTKGQSSESRQPLPVPKPSPPRFYPRGGDTGSATEGSAYDSDWRGGRSSRGWGWSNSWKGK